MKLSILIATSLLVASVSAQAADGPDANNTDRNERDRSGETLTPMDQSNSEHDLDMVAGVRRSIMEQDQISMTGQNVKVIANNGNVTLRGPVEDEDERLRIVNAARSVPGVVNVDNQLEITQ